MNFSLSVAFIVFHKFKYVVLSFLLNSQKSLISFLILVLTKLSFSNKLFNFNELLLKSSFNLLWSDQIQVIFKIFLYILRLALWLSMVNFKESSMRCWKDDISLLLGEIFYRYVRSICFIMTVNFIIFLYLILVWISSPMLRLGYWNISLVLGEIEWVILSYSSVSFVHIWVSCICSINIQNWNSILVDSSFNVLSSILPHHFWLILVWSLLDIRISIPAAYWIHLVRNIFPILCS